MIGRRYRHLRRYREIFNILASHGLGFVLKELGIHEFLALPGHVMRQEPLPMRQIGQRMRRVLQDLGPTYIKLGQIASTRADIFPAEILEELEMLQDRVFPVPIEEVRASLEKEWGQPLMEKFAYFAQEPLATASIGQVHYAELHDGRSVAVKVQRPGAKQMIEDDLELLGGLFSFLERRSHLAAQHRLSDLFEEFSASLRGELNYIEEGRNADRIRKNMARNADVYIPQVYWEYTTRHVLTMEFVTGIKLNQTSLLQENGYSLSHLAEKLSKVLLQQILEDGVFHADPHPGNLFVMSDGRLLFLDFGMVGSLPLSVKRPFVHLALGLFRGSTASILRAMNELGAVPEDADQRGLKEDIERLRNKYYEISLSEVNLGEAVRDLLAVAYRHRVAIPKDLVLVGRALLTLEGVVEQLDPSFSVMRAAQPFGFRLIKRQLEPRQWANRWADEVVDIGLDLRGLPRLASDVLRLVRSGSLRLSLHLDEQAGFKRMVERVVNRIAFSLVLLAFSLLMAALVLASAIGGADYFIWRFPIAEVGLVVAGVMFFIILWSIFRSGRF